MVDTGRADAAVRPGDVLAGKYRVERVLGQGGMGVVVAAHHIQLDEKVALKFLLPEATRSQEVLGRFLREARAAAKIKGEHVARVSDVGQLENGSPYIVMEYLEGTDLSGWLRERGVLSVEEAVDFVLQACEAIADAHAVGIVHRDLKPANLFCVRKSDGNLSIKVLDFGISKVTTPGAAGNDMTRTNALMGSPLYMSPEQMAFSKGVDSRTDIWSLGVILFELLTRRPPFEAEAVTQLAVKVATETAPRIRSYRADVPEGMEQVIATCLERDLARRYQNVGELAIALKDFGSKRARISVEHVLGTLKMAGMSAAVLPPSGEFKALPPVAASTPAITAPHTDANWGTTSNTRKGGGRTMMALGAVVVVALLGAGGFMLLHKPAPAVSAAASANTTAAVVAPPLATAVVPDLQAAAAAAPMLDASLPPPAAAPSAAAVPAARPGWSPPRPVTNAPPAAPAPLPVAVPGSAPAPAPAPAAAQAPNCDPNFTLDDQGRRHFKPECFLKK
jgi:hypothetical protein